MPRFSAADDPDATTATTTALVDAGLSPAAAAEVTAAVRDACVAASGVVIAAIATEIWSPFERAGCPQEQAHEVAAQLLQLRALLRPAFDAAFPGVLADVFDRTYEDEFQLAGRPDRAGGAGGPA